MDTPHWSEKNGPPSSRAGQVRSDEEKQRKQKERLYRRILFVIRWSNFKSYWDVVDTLERLASEYRQMLGDADEIIQKFQNLADVLEQDNNQ